MARLWPYCLVMPARKWPTPQDAAAARRILLDGLARDSDVSELASELAPLHPRNDTFPGEVFLHLAADALDWCGASRAEPLSLEGMREQFLPECSAAGRTTSSSSRSWQRRHCAAGPSLTCSARSPGGKTDDFWQYTLYAAVAYIRAAAGRADVPVHQACRHLAQREIPQPG